MKEVSITINLENDAFQPDPHIEVARILTEVSKRFLNNGEVFDMPLRDFNGNITGSVVTE